VKEINWYTGIIIATGLAGLISYVPTFNLEHWLIWLFIVILIIALDIYPIKMIDGSVYSIGTIGTIYLLYELGLGAVALEIVVSTLFFFIKINKSIKLINWKRYLITISMYFISAYVACLVSEMTKDINLFISVLLTVITFYGINTLLLTSVVKTITGTPFIQNMTEKLKEIIIPIMICTVVIPRFLIIQDEKDFFIEIIYTAFFLIIIIFYSNLYINQVTISQNVSSKFIEILEMKNIPHLSGHGVRVGEITSSLLDIIDYPKMHKNKLIQIATLHDIGKSLLPTHLLQKRGLLTLAEEKEYQSHTEMGRFVVSSIWNNKRMSNWIFYHHERWDGKGFPKGLKKNQIPFGARIIAVCNQLDHLMTRHSDNSTVYDLIQEMGGTVLDPNLVSKIDKSFINELRLKFSSDEKKEQLYLAEREELEFDAKSYIGHSLFFRYQNGKILGEAHQTSFPLKNKILENAAISYENKQVFHESFSFKDEAYEVHFYPIENQVIIFLHEITPMISYRDKLIQGTLNSYQDIIATLTENRVNLCLNTEEIVIKLGELVGSFDVQTTFDVQKSRHFIQGLILDQPPSLQSKILLAESEAATNMIKHSIGGTVQMYKKKELIQILVQDQGSGIPLHEIPKAILISGYSSKNSLGKGFLVMSRSADKIFINTSPSGTTLLMEFQIPFH